MSSIYYIHMTSSNETLSKICSTTSMPASDIIRINTQPYDENFTVGQLLTNYQLKGKKLPEGLSVRIPYPVTGGKAIKYTEYETSKVKDKVTGTEYKTKSVAKEESRFKYTLEKSSAPNMLSTVGDSWKQFNCYVIIYAGGKQQDKLMYLPIYPQEFSDNNEVHFGTTEIFGRSVPYQTYNGSGRSVSVTLSMHEELCTNYNYLHQLVSTIESACYPQYNSDQVQPPEIKLVIGKQFSCRGILTNCSANWKAPIIDGRYVNCDLSISIKETTGPNSMSDVKNRYSRSDSGWWGGRFK